MQNDKRNLGKEKETIAASYLQEKGYKILELNYQIRQAEIDIVAYDKETLVFIEVKYRKNNSAGNPLEAITLNKQRRICKAALFYMNQHRIDPYTSSIRFDAVGILGDEIYHLENAFPYIN